MEELIEIGYKHLSKQQIEIVEECLEKKNGIGLSLSMGSGKTIISLVLGLIKCKNKNKPFIVICSKTLISSWIFEINKFFEDKLKYVVFHSDYIKDLSSFELTEDIHLIIITPQICSKYYDLLNIQFDFIQEEIINLGMFNQHSIIHYKERKEFDSRVKIGGSIIHKLFWEFIIVDEAHNYTKITTKQSKSIISMGCKFRLCLSGTLHNEPSDERFLGYYLMINDRKFPDNLPGTKEFIRSENFKGLKNTIVKKEIIKKLEYNEIIVNVDLNVFEKKIYLCVKNIILEINKKIIINKLLNNANLVRKFNAQKLATIIYLRQCLVSPLIPLSNVAIDAYDLSYRNELSEIFNEKIMELDMGDYLTNLENLKSTRITKVLEIIGKTENIVIFSVYRTSLDLLVNFIKDRIIFTINGTMSIKKKSEILEKCSKCKEPYVLLLTYSIGSEGLNLQFSGNVLLMNFEWTECKTSQSLSRIVRQGNKSKTINVYFIVSNTGIEKAIFKKQKDKNIVLDEAFEGKIVSKVSTIKMDEIIKILEMEDNNELFRSI